MGQGVRTDPRYSTTIPCEVHSHFIAYSDRRLESPLKHVHDAIVRPVVFDLRDRSRTGLGRVARETVTAYRALFPCDPVTVLDAGGPRYSLRAQREWPGLRRRHPDAVWVWFHWDVPWLAMPERSVVYVHDLIHLRYASPLRRWVARRWIAHALRRASRVITVSQATAALLPCASTVIPNGVSATFATTWSPRDYVLAVGADRPHKNLGLVEQMGLPFVRARGVSDSELAALYAGARVVLVPSREEGFGLPVLEAFLSGAPVVASDIPALREVSGGLSTLVPADDISAWRVAVHNAWNNGGPPEPRRQWAESFTWERSARMLRNVITELL